MFRCPPTHRRGIARLLASTPHGVSTPLHSQASTAAAILTTSQRGFFHSNSARRAPATPPPLSSESQQKPRQDSENTIKDKDKATLAQSGEKRDIRDPLERISLAAERALEAFISEASESVRSGIEGSRSILQHMIPLRVTAPDHHVQLALTALEEAAFTRLDTANAKTIAEGSPLTASSTSSPSVTAADAPELAHGPTGDRHDMSTNHHNLLQRQAANEAFGDAIVASASVAEIKQVLRQMKKSGVAPSPSHFALIMMTTTVACTSARVIGSGKEGIHAVAAAAQSVKTASTGAASAAAKWGTTQQQQQQQQLHNDRTDNGFEFLKFAMAHCIRHNADTAAVWQAFAAGLHHTKASPVEVAAWQSQYEQRILGRRQEIVDAIVALQAEIQEAHEKSLHSHPTGNDALDDLLFPQNEAEGEGEHGSQGSSSGSENGNGPNLSEAGGGSSAAAATAAAAEASIATAVASYYKKMSGLKEQLAHAGRSAAVLRQFMASAAADRDIHRCLDLLRTCRQGLNAWHRELAQRGAIAAAASPSSAAASPSINKEGDVPTTYEELLSLSSQWLPPPVKSAAELPLMMDGEKGYEKKPLWTGDTFAAASEALMTNLMSMAVYATRFSPLSNDGGLRSAAVGYLQSLSSAPATTKQQQAGDNDDNHRVGGPVVALVTGSWATLAQMIPALSIESALTITRVKGELEVAATKKVKQELEEQQQQQQQRKPNEHDSALSSPNSKGAVTVEAGEINGATADASGVPLFVWEALLRYMVAEKRVSEAEAAYQHLVRNLRRTFEEDIASFERVLCNAVSSSASDHRTVAAAFTYLTESAFRTTVDTLTRITHFMMALYRRGSDGPPDASTTLGFLWPVHLETVEGTAVLMADAHARYLRHLARWCSQHDAVAATTTSTSTTAASSSSSAAAAPTSPPLSEAEIATYVNVKYSTFLKQTLARTRSMLLDAADSPEIADTLFYELLDQGVAPADTARKASSNASSSFSSTMPISSLTSLRKVYHQRFNVSNHFRHLSRKTGVLDGDTTLLDAQLMVPADRDATLRRDEATSIKKRFTAQQEQKKHNNNQGAAVRQRQAPPTTASSTSANMGIGGGHVSGAVRKALSGTMSPRWSDRHRQQSPEQQQRQQRSPSSMDAAREWRASTATAEARSTSQIAQPQGPSRSKDVPTRTSPSERSDATAPRRTAQGSASTSRQHQQRHGGRGAASPAQAERSQMTKRSPPQFLENTTANEDPFAMI